MHSFLSYASDQRYSASQNHYSKSLSLLGSYIGVAVVIVKQPVNFLHLRIKMTLYFRTVLKLFL